MGLVQSRFCANLSYLALSLHIAWDLHFSTSSALVPSCCAAPALELLEKNGYWLISYLLFTVNDMYEEMLSLRQAYRRSER